MVHIKRSLKSNFEHLKITLMKNFLRDERKRKKITQEQLASRVGVSRQSINAIERGKYTPSTALALKISEIFNTTVNSLFELEPIDYQKRVEMDQP